MSKVLTFSTRFPSYHPKAGQPTYFVEKILKSLFTWEFIQKYGLLTNEEISPFVSGYIDFFEGISEKNHTIRSGHRFKAGDYVSPRIWGNDVNPKSGRTGAYQSKQIVIAPDIKVEKVWKFEMIPAAFWDECKYKINGKLITDKEELRNIATNDGLELNDFGHWFAGPCIMSANRKPFDGQIICWNPNINY